MLPSPMCPTITTSISGAMSRTARAAPSMKAGTAEIGTEQSVVKPTPAPLFASVTLWRTSQRFARCVLQMLQTGTPTSWLASESPNPMNNAPTNVGQTVGYPVTIQGPYSDTLTISAFSISTAAGVNVPCEESDPTTMVVGSELNGAAMCVPFSPLTPNTQYTATVTGTKNGQAFTVSWNWTAATTTMNNRQVMRYNISK
jgi:hypothetical protein